ncbi:MAG: MMPL family transporter [Desulfovibrio sp.]|jgi:predicted RND superfamily exporter protein|nr:MMPL family transporter [Desulfovibrio sp.]
MLNVIRVNRHFRRLAEYTLRFRPAVIAVSLLLAACAGMGMPHLRQDTSQESWFLEGDEMLRVKERFEEIFGQDDYCAVFLRADKILTRENLSLIRELGRELRREVSYADDVVSITDSEVSAGTEGGFEIVTPVPGGDAPIPGDADALARIGDLVLSKPMLKNRLLSGDGREAWVVLRLKPVRPGAEEEGGRGEAAAQRIGRAAKQVAEREKYLPLHPICAGMPVLDVEKRDYFSRETPRLIGVSLLITVIVMGIALRNPRAVLFPVAVAVCALLIVLGLQGHMRISMDPATVFLPVFLSLALSTCYSIHILNFFRREFARTGDRRESVLRAAEESGWSLLFSSLTTIVGLLSFLVIPLRPIRWVGLTAACLVGVIWLLVFTLLPVVLSFGKNREPLPPENREGLLDRLLDGFGRRVLLRPGRSLAVFGLLFAVSLAGLAQLEISFDIRRTSGLKVPYVARMIAVGESAVGSLYSYGLALEFSGPDQAKDPENLKNLRLLTREIEGFPLTKRVTSLADILEDLNQVLHDGDPAWRRLPDGREEVAQLLLLYENAGGREAEKWVDYDYQLLRLQIEVGDYDAAEAMREMESIRRRAAALFPGAGVLLTGSLSHFTVMMDYITHGQVRSLLSALASIAVLLAFSFASLRIGLIAMIPNAAPTLAVGGLMGFAGIPLDMMTVTIMPMLLGLAVDDTIHFINHCSMEFARTGSYAESTRRTFVSVGRAIFLTSVVLILAFAAYITSDMNVFRHMGILIGAGVAAALLADYYITPVLLYKMRVFGRETPPGAVRPENI